MTIKILHFTWESKRECFLEVNHYNLAKTSTCSSIIQIFQPSLAHLPKKMFKSLMTLKNYTKLEMLESISSKVWSLFLKQDWKCIKKNWKSLRIWKHKLIMRCILRMNKYWILILTITWWCIAVSSKKKHSTPKGKVLKI